jgi:hypothetical protein
MKDVPIDLSPSRELIIPHKGTHTHTQRTHTDMFVCEERFSVCLFD